MRYDLTMLVSIIVLVTSLVRLLRGEESTWIPTSKHHSESEIRSLEEELSDGTFKAAVDAVEGGFLVRWRLIDPMLNLYSYVSVFFFVLSAASLSIGLLTFAPNNISVGLVGMPITLLISRIPAFCWRMSTRTTYNRLFAK